MNHYTGLVLHELAMPDPALDLLGRGDVHRMIHDVAARRVEAMSTVEALDRFSGMRGSRRLPPGVTWREAVTDNLVHGRTSR